MTDTPPKGPRTLREQLDAALFALYCQATEGETHDYEAFLEYALEDVGVVLRVGDKAVRAMAAETGLDIVAVGATKIADTQSEKT